MQEGFDAVTMAAFHGWVRSIIKRETDRLFKIDDSVYPKGRAYYNDETPRGCITVEAWAKHDDGSILTIRRHVPMP
jgi:hypothetical protein